MKGGKLLHSNKNTKGEPSTGRRKPQGTFRRLVINWSIEPDKGNQEVVMKQTSGVHKFVIRKLWRGEGGKSGGQHADVETR